MKLDKITSAPEITGYPTYLDRLEIGFLMTRVGEMVDLCVIGAMKGLVKISENTHGNKSGTEGLPPRPYDL